MKQNLIHKHTLFWIIWRPPYLKCDLKYIKASLQPSGQRLITYFALEFTSANDRSQKVPPTERTRMQSRRECLKNPFGHARRIARGGLLTMTLGSAHYPGIRTRILSREWIPNVCVEWHMVVEFCTVTTHSYYA